MTESEELAHFRICLRNMLGLEPLVDEPKTDPSTQHFEQLRLDYSDVTHHFGRVPKRSTKSVK